MGFRYLSVRRDGPVEHLTLDRPDVHNAFNDEVIAELTAWAAAAAADPALRAVVLAGAGKSFSAGADVNWMARTVTFTEEENLRDARAMAAMFRAIDTLPCAVVGRVQGAALGGGTGLAAVCDVVVATRAALFGFTEVKLGILPAVISPFAVAKVGVSAARALMVTGARFPAERAMAIGLVHRVVEDDAALDEAVAAEVREVLGAAPGAVAKTKALLREVAWREAGLSADVTTRAIAGQRVSAEGQQGLTAFLQKRRPPWLA
jgi:methylglutaconyl-CoA hydratase